MFESPSPLADDGIGPVLSIVGHIGYDIIWSSRLSGERCIGGSGYYASVGAAPVSKGVKLLSCIPDENEELSRATHHSIAG